MLKPETGLSLGIIVGSAFRLEMLTGHRTTRVDVDTAWGPWVLHRIENLTPPAWLSFRHGNPHVLLPNQIPYRAQAAAFAEVGCGALLVTSSVGVLTPDLPLFEPLLLADIITLDNRLPDGGACTMFTEPHPDHGHLVLSESLFSIALSQQMKTITSAEGFEMAEGVVFGYVGGPRTKTRAENRMWRLLGAHVNSMTLAPEVILANELGIPCAGIAVGHKYSVPDIETPADEQAVSVTLERSRDALARIVRAFAERGQPVPFANHIYRYDVTTE